MSNCIALNHADYRGRSWCGRDMWQEWHFVSLDHAALSEASGNGITACRACVKAAVATLKGANVKPPGWDRKVPREVMTEAQKRAGALRLGKALEQAGLDLIAAAEAPDMLAVPSPLPRIAEAAERLVKGLVAVVVADDGSGS